MAHDEPAASGAPTKLVIRNIGLLLSGDIAKPILDADTIVAINGRITAVGRAKDLDDSGATTLIDAVPAAPEVASSSVVEGPLTVMAPEKLLAPLKTSAVSDVTISEPLPPRLPESTPPPENVSAVGSVV